jgi:hypothetical protein
MESYLELLLIIVGEGVGLPVVEAGVPDGEEARDGGELSFFLAGREVHFCHLLNPPGPDAETSLRFHMIKSRN